MQSIEWPFKFQVFCRVHWTLTSSSKGLIVYHICLNTRWILFTQYSVFRWWITEKFWPFIMVNAVIFPWDICCKSTILLAVLQMWYIVEFYVLLTMHPCIIFFKWSQLGAHYFLVYLFQLLYMFRATMCPSSGELTVSMRHWYFALCMFSWWWAHSCPKHVQKLK